MERLKTVSILNAALCLQRLPKPFWSPFGRLSRPIKSSPSQPPQTNHTTVSLCRHYDGEVIHSTNSHLVLITHLGAVLYSEHRERFVKRLLPLRYWRTVRSERLLNGSKRQIGGAFSSWTLHNVAERFATERPVIRGRFLTEANSVWTWLSAWQNGGRCLRSTIKF